MTNVIAVLGYSRRAAHTDLHPVCADRLAHAQTLASPEGTVILSGEADLMRAAWTGPDVVLVCDPDSRSTSDNARNVAAAARELGATEVVLVTSRWHGLRAGILVRAALRGSGIRLRLAPAKGRPPPTLVARELVCLALLPFQLARLRL
jgi:DUF218 domain